MRTSGIKTPLQISLPVSSQILKAPSSNTTDNLEMKGSNDPCGKCFRFFTQLAQRFINYIKELWYALFPKPAPLVPEPTPSTRKAFTELEKAFENEIKMKSWQNDPITIELQKITEIVANTGFSQEKITFWQLEKFNVHSCPNDEHRKIVADLVKRIRESGTTSLRYGKRLRNLPQRLFDEFFVKVPKYPSLYILKS